MGTAIIPAPNLNVKKTDIINNLTSGGTTVPLSAEMGKEINDSLALQPTTVTLASGVSAEVNDVAKQLNIVFLSLACSKSQWEEDDLIATLPFPYRPTNTVFTFAMNYNMPSDNVQVSIGSNGQIRIWNKGVQAQGMIYITALWFVGLDDSRVPTF